MANDKLNINITAVAPGGDTFERLDTSSACATCTTAGVIDVSSCTNPVDISWTFTTSDTFRTAPAGKAVTFSANGAGKGNTGIFGTVVLSNNNQTATVTDANPNAANRGNNDDKFNYTIHEKKNADDPTIQNRK